MMPLVRWLSGEKISLYDADVWYFGAQIWLGYGSTMVPVKASMDFFGHAHTLETILGSEDAPHLG